MAATLLLIKSFAMLPHPELADSRRGRGTQARPGRAAARISALSRGGGEARRARDPRAATFSPRRARPLPEQTPKRTPQFTVSIFDLVEAMGAVLKRLADKTPREIELRDIPVARMYPAHPGARSKARHESSSPRCSRTANDRSLVIATFMALLELIRRGASSRIPGRALRPDFARARAPLEVGAAVSHERLISFSSGRAGGVRSGRGTTQSNSRKSAVRGRRAGLDRTAGGGARRRAARRSAKALDDAGVADTAAKAGAASMIEEVAGGYQLRTPKEHALLRAQAARRAAAAA